MIEKKKVKKTIVKYQQVIANIRKFELSDITLVDSKINNKDLLYSPHELIL